MLNRLPLSRARQQKEIQYSGTYMLQTLTRFEGVVVGGMIFIDTVVMNLPPEQRAIAATATAFLWLIIEWVFSEANGTITAIVKPG